MIIGDQKSEKDSGMKISRIPEETRDGELKVTSNGGMRGSAAGYQRSQI
jgi:hypothetical protein